MNAKRLNSILKSRERKILIESSLRDLRPQNTISDWFAGTTRGRIPVNIDYIKNTYASSFILDVSEFNPVSTEHNFRFITVLGEAHYLSPNKITMICEGFSDRRLAVMRHLERVGCQLTRSMINLRNRRRSRVEHEEFASSRTLIDKIRSRDLTPDVFKYDRAIGIEIECYGEYLKEKLPYWCREAGDGSLNSGGVEFKLLVKRSELEARLNRFTNLIKGTHKVNRTCGLHVHLDQRGKTKDEVLKLAKKLDKWLYALREFVPESRRGGDVNRRNYCRFGISANGNDRYHAVNMAAFYKYKTLEIRLHSGTTDYTKIISWIRLLEILSVIKAPAKGLEGISALAAIPLCEYEKSYWIKRHQELNPRLYTSITPATESE